VKLFFLETDNIFDVLKDFLIIESVQPSMYYEKVRAIFKFYLLALFYSFVSYHTRVVTKSLVNIHKHQCKFRIDASLFTTLLKETCGLQITCAALTGSDDACDRSLTLHRGRVHGDRTVLWSIISPPWLRNGTANLQPLRRMADQCG
jgi:hypothetical protein